MTRFRLARVSYFLSGLLLALTLLSACGDSTGSPLSILSNTPTPSAAVTTLAPTTNAATTAPVTTVATVAPTNTSAPTTAPAIAPTDTPQPTLTPEPEPTATPRPATVAPTATAIPAMATPTPGQLPGKITFQSANNIFVINPDGSGRRKVTQGFSPRFSPDGKRIAFITPDGAAVASVKLDGSDLQYHCGTGGQVSRVVRWSPSGKFIAVYSRENGPGVSIGAVQLCDTTAKGVAELRNAKALGQNSVHVWEWSSDGNSAVFQINTPNSAEQALYDLWYGDPDKGVDAATPLTLQNHVAITQAGVFYLDARISPTNRSIAVVGDKIFFLNVPGQQSKLNEQTLDQFNLAQGVAWSPDTEALLVAGKLDAEDGLFLYHFDSGKITKLVSDYTEGQIDWTRQ